MKFAAVNREDIRYVAGDSEQCDLSPPYRYVHIDVNVHINCFVGCHMRAATSHGRQLKFASAAAEPHISKSFLQTNTT